MMTTNYLMIITFILLLTGNDITRTKQEKISVQKEDQKPTGQNLLQKKQLEGIDFYAIGTAHSWLLDMDFESDFHFKTMSGIDITVPAAKGVKAMDANVVRYRSVNKSAELIIRLSHEACTDNGSDRSFHYRVTVDYKSTGMEDYQTYTGCGNYVPDIRLNDIWAVIQLDETTLDPHNFKKGSPTIELNLAKNSLIGFDGCNRFRGSFEVTDNQIIFSNLAGTRMACPNMEISDRIATAISGKQLRFILNNGRLILSKNNKIVMTLKHVD